MDELDPKFSKLEAHLNYLVEQINLDISYLGEADEDTQDKYMPLLQNVMKRICLMEGALQNDISFLHQEFKERILKYELDLEEEFSQEEVLELSKELLKQIQPENYV